MKKTKRFWAGLAALALLGGVGAASFSYVASNESAAVQVKAAEEIKTVSISVSSATTNKSADGVAQMTFSQGKNSSTRPAFQNGATKVYIKNSIKVELVGAPKGSLIKNIVFTWTVNANKNKDKPTGISATAGTPSFNDKSVSNINQTSTTVSPTGAAGSLGVSAVQIEYSVPFTGPEVTSNVSSLSGLKGKDGIITLTASNFTGEVSYTWSSSDPSVANVDNDLTEGNSAHVEYKEIGTAVVSCVVSDGTHSVTIEVPVKVGVKATGISLSKSELTLTKGESSVLTATLLPEGAVGVVEWSSSNPSVATVADGKVSAEGIGEAVITAKCGELSKTCKVTVNPIHGTVITDPYSPDEAVSHMDDMQKNASETYFVKGVCSKIAFKYNGSESMSIFVGKDSSSETFEFYKMKVSENPHISIGDIVVASSLGENATIYKNTYEFNPCTMYSVEYVGLDNFVKNYMHMDAKVDAQGMTADMSCKSWYADAKSAYNALNSDQKAVFQTNAYEAARLRLANWAKANGDTLSESGISSINRSAITELNSDSKTAFIVTALGIGGVVAAIGYFLARNKKHN